MSGPTVKNQTDNLLLWLSEIPEVADSGYSIVSMELDTRARPTLRIFIENNKNPDQKIKIEDCTAFHRIVDPILDQPEAQKILTKLEGAYDLEISSPGINRPLRTIADFDRFQKSRARIHLFRALKSDEINNPGYFEKNPNQKNFLGHISGIVSNDTIQFIPEGASSEISIPHALISKAALEPHLWKEKTQ